MVAYHPRPKRPFGEVSCIIWSSKKLAREEEMTQDIPCTVGWVHCTEPVSP